MRLDLTLTIKEPVTRVALQNILIVAGTPAERANLESRLIAFGYQIAGVVSSVHAALTATVPREPDLAMLISAMPGETSGIAVDDLQRRWKCAVVVLVSAVEETRARAAETRHPFECIAEPFTERELRTGIELATLKYDQMRTVREMEDRYFANSIDMLCFLDFNGYFKRLNPAWEHTLGFTREELMSRPFIEFVHPDDRERTLQQNALVRGGGQALAFENRYLCKDGSYRWFLWNATPDSSQRVIYSMARDITVRKQAQEEREQLVLQLQCALAEVKRLQEILPICSYCKRIRDDDNDWHTVESYISMHTSSLFSHGICPSCLATELEAKLGSISAD